VTELSLASILVEQMIRVGGRQKLGLAKGRHVTGASVETPGLCG